MAIETPNVIGIPRDLMCVVLNGRDGGKAFPLALTRNSTEDA